MLGFSVQVLCPSAQGLLSGHFLIFCMALLKFSLRIYSSEHSKRLHEYYFELLSGKSCMSISLTSFTEVLSCSFLEHIHFFLILHASQLCVHYIKEPVLPIPKDLPCLLIVSQTFMTFQSSCFSDFPVVKGLLRSVIVPQRRISVNT